MNKEEPETINEEVKEEGKIEQIKEVTEEVKTEVEKSSDEKKEEIKTEKEIDKEIKKDSFDVEGWKPKTEVGKRVKNGEIKEIDNILDRGLKIPEIEIVDLLIPDLETDLLFIGQSKGKFGGGQKRVFKQTQKKTAEGNKPKFATYAVVGNSDGYVGVGYGKAKETVPAREKAIRKAKLNIIKIRRGCGSWQCGCNEPHSIPFAVEGKCGSVRIKISPAPKGTGLKIENECSKLLKLAGIQDVWTQTKGQTKITINLIAACMDALRKLISVKIKPQHVKGLGIIEGKIKQNE